MKRKHGAWFYVGYVLAWAVAIIVGAALAGAILFPLIGKLFGSTRGVGELALSGARHLAEWTAKVWALSFGIVLCLLYTSPSPRD